MMNMLRWASCVAVLASAAIGQTPGGGGSQPVVPPSIRIHNFDGRLSVEVTSPCDCIDIALYAAPCPPATGTPIFVGSVSTWLSFAAHGFSNGAVALDVPVDPALSGSVVSVQFMAICIGGPPECFYAQCVTFSLP